MRILAALLLLLASLLPLRAQEIEVVAAGLDHPWALAFLPDGGFLVTERPGRLRRISAGGAVSAPIDGLPPVYAEGQGGLFDIALAPDFAASGGLYLTYAYGSRAENGTALLRARLEPGRLAGVETVFRATPKAGAHHFGGRLAVLEDGTLLLTLGDGFAYRERAQTLDGHLGTILRLAPDGSAPADNPFADRPGARPEIWSFGHRNVQAIAIDPASGRVWTAEHGPRGGDELDVLQRGGNHGWPLVTAGRDYSGARISPWGLERGASLGLVAPVHVWTPSIAPAAMAFYTGAAFPDWQGDLFVAALAGQAIHRLRLDGTRVVAEERLFHGLGQRFRDVRPGPDGFLYLLTDAADGQLLRVRPAR